MRVLVTGGAGFVGSAVCRYLVGETGAAVLNIDKLGHGSSLTSLEVVSYSPRFTFRKVDIRDRTRVAALLDAFEPDSIIHLAAETHVDRAIDAAEGSIGNIVSTYRLLEAVRGYWAALPERTKPRFRFLHVSTDEVYGSRKAGRYSETNPYDPSSPYAASKAASDHLVLAWHRTYGLPALISHCSNNYGPYQFPERLVPSTIVRAIEGRPLHIDGDGSNIRNWLHVADHARALHAILIRGRAGERYNIGGRSERSDLEMVECIAQLVDELRPGTGARKGSITFVENRPGHERRYAIDATELETELGWKAEISFEAGLRKTVRWYLANERWWRPLREWRYGGERLAPQIRELVA